MTVPRLETYTDALTSEQCQIVMQDGWYWAPTWTWSFPPDGGKPIKVWTGQEVLHDQDDEVLAVSRGRIGRSGATIQRRAAPPDRSPPTDQELEANAWAAAERRRARLGTLRQAEAST